MNLDLRSVQYVVFDEADRLFEMGFETAMSEILHRLPAARQTRAAPRLIQAAAAAAKCASSSPIQRALSSLDAKLASKPLRASV